MRSASCRWAGWTLAVSCLFASCDARGVVGAVHKSVEAKPDPHAIGVWASTGSGLIELRSYGVQGHSSEWSFDFEEASGPPLHEGFVHAFFVNIPDARVTESKLMAVPSLAAFSSGQSFRQASASPAGLRPLSPSMSIVEGSLYRLFSEDLSKVSSGLVALRVVMPMGTPDRLYAIQIGERVVDDAEAQRKTVADIRNVGTAMMSWLTDQIAAGAAGQQVVDMRSYPPITRESLSQTLVPQYIQSLPADDGWGHPYEYHLNKDFSQKRILCIRSAGRDGVFSREPYSPGAFDPAQADEDVVWADGFFVRWPQVTR